MAHWTRKAKRLKEAKGKSLHAVIAHFTKHVDYGDEARAAIAEVFGVDVDTVEYWEVDDTAHASQHALDRAAEGGNLKNYEKASRADLAAMTGYENYIQKEADTMKGKLS